MTQTAIPEGYWMDSKGRLVPEHMVKETDQLEDQTVRKIAAFARDLSAQIARFRAHSFADIAAFRSLIAEKYGLTVGGAKGNLTLSSYDGCLKVQLQIADQITFGPQLQVAKGLIDRCISSWSEGSDDKIKRLVDHAFQVNQAGKINMDAVLGLRRLEIADPVWQQAMSAIADAIRVVGSTTYLRVFQRPDPEARWEMIQLDLASVSDVAVPKDGGQPIPVIAETAVAGEPS
jgi:hypothetical protein